MRKILKKIKLEIDTQDWKLLFDLFQEPGKTTYVQGDQKEIANGVTITNAGLTLHESFGVSDTLTLIISFAEGVTMGAAGNLLSSWIIDKLKGKATVIRVNRREVHLDNEGRIRKLIEEEITQEE